MNILQFLNPGKKQATLGAVSPAPKKKRKRVGEPEEDTKRARLVKNAPPAVFLRSVPKKSTKTVRFADESTHVNLTERYKTEYVNDKMAFDQIVGYLKSPAKVIKPLMIRGPSGCGKGTAIYKAAEMFKTRVHEIDLDEYKTVQQFLDSEVVRNIVISNDAVKHRKHITLVRGLEGYTADYLNKKLKPAIVKAYASYEEHGRRTHVLVFTATHQYDRNVKPLEGVCGLVKWMRPLKDTMVARLFDRAMRDNPSYRHLLRKRTQMIVDARGDARSMFNSMMLNEVPEGTVCVSEQHQRDVVRPEGFFDYMRVFFERARTNPEHLSVIDGYLQSGVFMNAPRYAPSVNAMVEFTEHWSSSSLVRSDHKEIDMSEFVGIRAQLLGEYTRATMRQNGFRARAADNSTLMPPTQRNASSYGTSMRRCKQAQGSACGYLPSSMEIHERLMLPEVVHPIHPKEYQDKAALKFMNKNNKLVVPARITKQAREQSKGDRIVLTSSFKGSVPDAFKASRKVLQDDDNDETALSAASFLLG